VFADGFGDTVAYISIRLIVGPARAGIGYGESLLQHETQHEVQLFSSSDTSGLKLLSDD